MSISKPRILCFIVGYPKFSETYMHEEIVSLARDFEIKVLTYKAAEYPRREPYPYEVIPYPDPCPVYAPIEKVNQDFSNPSQVEFLKRVQRVIDGFKPDFLHGHYLGMGLLLRRLAERNRIPFTLRTHSMDVLSGSVEKHRVLCRAANSSWCKRVLVFPGNFRNILVERGLDETKLVDCWPVINYAKFHQPERRPLTGKVMCAGPAQLKKAHEDFIDLAAMMKDSGLTFDLYTQGLRRERSLIPRNYKLGQPVNLRYEDPDQMPRVYTDHDWLVYPIHTETNTVGLPCAVAEAQASGIGVCMQEVPGRREEQLAYLGGAGFLYRDIRELPELLSRPYPDEMRDLGLSNAGKCDIEAHRGLLTEVWLSAVAD